MLQRFLGWFRPRPIQSLFARPQRGNGKTSNLYIVRVDFPLKPEMEDRLQRNLDVLRERYGIDFLVLEPGIRLSRFDEI
jgi:hypothetical protein